jgi:hypothetical protein
MTPTGGSTLRLCEASADKRVLYCSVTKLADVRSCLGRGDKEIGK